MRWRRWTARSAAAGAVAWLGVAALGRPGLIESLFLLAPLIAVPLALRLIACDSPSLALRAAMALQPGAAGLAAASFFLPAGPAAAGVAAPWALVTALLGLTGLLRLPRVFREDFGSFLGTAAMLLVPVGGAWLVASRAGRPLGGFPEPIVLLTAVHFHFTAFAGPILTAAAGRAAATKPIMRAVFRGAGLGMVFGTPLLAAGFVFSPVLKLVSALALVVAFTGTALLQLRAIPAVEGRLPRALLAVSAACVVAGMALEAVYEIGFFTGRAWISIPEMARTHGILNGLGFVLGGLLAWTLDERSAAK